MNRLEILSPKIDFVFKRIFGNEKHPKILISFLNSVMTNSDPIESVEILNTDIEKEHIDDKFSRLDIKARTNKGEIVNLIDNAIKYSRTNGNIDINCYKDNDHAIIKVSDDGIGIEKSDIYKIFDPFYRVDKHRSREAGGAGLGLSLVKKLVEKQGGEIKVESEIGTGSSFYVIFPI